MGAINVTNTVELELHKVISSMWKTAKDMNYKYKETSEGSSL